MSLVEMAEAHIENVKQRIVELGVQKDAISSEILKLSKYLENCQAELSKEVAKVDSSVSVNNN